MDRNQILGTVKVLKGKTKVALGKTFGAGRLEARGHADQVAGKIQKASGTVKTTLKDKIRNA